MVRVTTRRAFSIRYCSREFLLLQVDAPAVADHGARQEIDLQIADA